MVPPEGMRAVTKIIIYNHLRVLACMLSIAGSSFKRWSVLSVLVHAWSRMCGAERAPHTSQGSCAVRWSLVYTLSTVSVAVCVVA